MNEFSPIQFIKEDIWQISEQDLPKVKRTGIYMLKVIILAVQGFKNDLCPLRASALTLYTLLSIVPVIALLFGVAKGFGFEKKLEQELLEKASDQDTMMLQLIEFSQNMLANTKGGVVAGIGIIVLFWTVIKVIGNIEVSFNHIWKIEKNRTLARKLSDYLSLMMLAPILLIASSSITVFVKTKLTWLVEVMNLPEFGTKLVLYAMSFSPLVIMSVLFSFIFLFMPNHKISYKSGVIAGIVTAVLYQLVQTIYLGLQIGASSYNAIYGSFAALPLFLAWLQIVWMVVLFGCEISFFIQNYEGYRHNKKFSNLSFSLKKNIAVQVCYSIVNRFANGDSAPNADEIASQLHLPISVTQSTINDMLACQLIVELKTEENEEPIYQPARDINSLTVDTVNQALEDSGQDLIPSKNNQQPLANFNQFQQNQLIKDISLMA